LEYSYIDNIRVSKLTLGTAQLGMDYGISNVLGKPSIDTALAILQAAYDFGINSFDTAPVYCESEKILGNFYEGLEKKNLIITSKLPNFPFKQKKSQAFYQKFVLQSIMDSLKHLRLEKIPIYLLHNAKNLTSHNGAIFEALKLAKREGLIDHLGVSVYEPSEVLEALHHKEIKVIQGPLNIFDQRFIKTGLLKLINEKKIVFFARSVFLQGLFFIRPEKLPAKLKSAKSHLEKLKFISKQEKINIEHLALNFVKQQAGVSSIIIGVESPSQLKKNLISFSEQSISRRVINEIHHTFKNIPNEIIDPRKW